MLRNLCCAVPIALFASALAHGQVQLQHTTPDGDAFRAGKRVRLTVPTTPPWHEIGHLTGMVVFFEPASGSQGEEIWLNCNAVPTLTSSGALTCETDVPTAVVTGNYDPGTVRLNYANLQVNMQHAKSEAVEFEGLSAEEWQRIKNTQLGNVKLSK